MIREYDSEAWTLSIGTNPGYDPNQTDEKSDAEYARLYLACAEQVFRESGVYISATFQKTGMLYHRDWGCPEAGEPGFLLHGVRNPQFAERNAYEAALQKLAALLMAQLQQSAVYLEIRPTRLLYITNEDKRNDDERERETSQ